MEHKLEAVVVPVSDVDRSRHFYRAVGFRLDLDQAAREGHRVVQLTPPGSMCSILIGTDISSAEPGSTVGVLKVPDLDAAVADLRARGAAPGPITRCDDGFAHASFRDPDGNLWLLVDGIHLTG
ncbi:MAG TPA: VOC family protein [Kribbella sp.]|nr:VOC family protein [Kribbella sp.]